MIVKLLDQTAYDILSPSFCFEVGEEIVMLSDLIDMIDSDSGRTEIILSGKKPAVRAYIRILRKNKSKGFKFNKCDVLKRSLPDHVVREIAASLPSQPWKQGIHKRVAEAYGISNNQMTRVIRKILADSELSVLIGTKPKFS